MKDETADKSTAAALGAAAATGDAQAFAPVLAAAKSRMKGEEWQEAASRALEAAVKGGHGEIVAQLLDAGAPATARFAWNAAARAGNVAILEILKAKSGDEPLGPEADRVTGAFNAAAGAGQQDAAAWLIQNFARRFGANEIVAAAKRAMVAGDDATALFLVEAAPAAPGLRSRDRQIIKNNLMSHALQLGAFSVIDRLYGDTQHSYATMLAHAAQADNAATFAHVMGMAKAAGHVFPPVDIETPLMMATDHGCHAVVDYILENVPVNIHVHNDGPVRNAVDRYPQDGFAPVARLLSKGADAHYAQARAAEKFPGDRKLGDEIARFAEESDARARGLFDRHVADIAPGLLFRHDPALGMAPAFFAAENRLMPQLLEKHAGAMNAADFLAPDVRGETLLSVIERTGQLAGTFTPALWAGRQETAAAVLVHLSENSKKSFDAANFLRESEILMLRRSARGQAGRFRL